VYGCGNYDDSVSTTLNNILGGGNDWHGQHFGRGISVEVGTCFSSPLLLSRGFFSAAVICSHGMPRMYVSQVRSADV
jgi:hypothetical protein